MTGIYNNGFGLSQVELKDEKIAIGMCGLIKRKDLEKPDIGYAFLPEYWGMGYAVEIAMAVKNYALDTLCLDEILAITMPSNLKSIKVLEKIGLTFKRNHSIEGKNEILSLYSTDL